VKLLFPLFPMRVWSVWWGVLCVFFVLRVGCGPCLSWLCCPGGGAGGYPGLPLIAEPCAGMSYAIVAV